MPEKAIGKNCLTFDELMTLVTEVVNEVEGVLNSKHLTYVYSDDIIEPLTPSNLLVGYRVLTLPDDTISQDVDNEHTPGNFTKKAAHLVKTLTNFWKSWEQEYLLELN